MREMATVEDALPLGPSYYEYSGQEVRRPIRACACTSRAAAPRSGIRAHALVLALARAAPAPPYMGRRHAIWLRVRFVMVSRAQ